MARCRNKAVSVFGAEGLGGNFGQAEGIRLSTHLHPSDHLFLTGSDVGWMR